MDSERSPGAVPPPERAGEVQQGQVYLSSWPTRLLGSPLIPRPLLLRAFRGAARLMRLRIERRDRLEARREPHPPIDDEPRLWFADIYHGGVTFWDWILLPGGGFWWSVLWPLVIRTSVERLRRYPEARTVLELDAHSYEELAGRSPSDVEALRSGLATGRLEVVNGTYAQPLAPTVGGEANLRHFFYGLDAIEGILGAEVKSFVAGEPQFVTQLPQILSNCGIENLVLRTHWAPFGTDPEIDADVVRWRGPDGSEVRTVPRYSFMDYLLQKADHPGVQNAGLTGDDFENWTSDDKEQFAAEAQRRGIERPLVTRLADPKPPESPFPGIVAAARNPRSRMVTVREYCELPHQNPPQVSYTIDDIPTTIPWGLAGEQLHREQAAAETALLTAERLDAILQTMGAPGEQQRLDTAWKLLMRGQHHDLHLCAPWHSVRHDLSMGEIGCRFAREGKENAEGVTKKALERLAERFGPESSDGRTFLLFNPSPWPRRELVELPGTDGRHGGRFRTLELPRDRAGDGDPDGALRAGWQNPRASLERERPAGRRRSDRRRRSRRGSLTPSAGAGSLRMATASPLGYPDAASQPFGEERLTGPNRSRNGRGEAPGRRPPLRGGGRYGLPVGSQATPLVPEVPGLVGGNCSPRRGGGGESSAPLGSPAFRP